MPLRRINSTVAQKAINREAKSFSPKTVRNVYGLLTAVVNQYTGERLSISLPQKIPYEGTVLDEDELKSLIKAVDGDLIEVPILLALFLGLRRSEIVALEHSDYNAKKKTLSIRKAAVMDKDNTLVTKTTKTVKSNRTLSVPPYLAEKLEAKISVNEAFCTVTPSHICTRLGWICEANDIPKIRLHDLRHQNASVMLALGVADKYAMERGGWSSNATMKNIYQHTMTAERAAVDTRINNYFEALAQSG